jgi:hypothetical protein
MKLGRLITLKVKKSRKKNPFFGEMRSKVEVEKSFKQGLHKAT